MVSNRLRDDDVERHLRQACAELERRLRAGEPCAAEDWLVTSAVLAFHFEAALELVYAEFVVREQLGQRPAPEAWYARFPQWRRDLEQLFQVHQLGRANSDQDFATTVTMVRREHDAPGSGLAGLPIAPGRFGNYELLAEIGRGGMGAVYKARPPGDRGRGPSAPLPYRANL